MDKDFKNYDDNEILYMIRENQDNYSILFEKYKDTILKICKYYAPLAKEYGLLLEDLIQLANLGIIKAIDSYNSSSNTLFYTYLVHCIKNSIKNEIRDQQTFKKKTLNSAISYDIVEPSTGISILEKTPDENSPDPVKSLIEEYETSEYCKFLNSLPFEAAVAFELRTEGFSISEISNFLQINRETFDRYIRMAKYKLNKMLN